MRNLSSFKNEGFRTVVDVRPFPKPVFYTDRIMLSGSCFTEHIGNRLINLKFQAILNPFGIVYNPLTIADQLHYLINPTGFSRDDLVFHQDLWYSWMHHGRFSNSDPDALLKEIDDQAAACSKFLKNTDLLILTFGTTECYYLKSNNRRVANCHQVPAAQFYSGKSDNNEMLGVWIPLIESLLRFNPNLNICFTISPVRYFKDGPTGNQLSKASLFLFIERLIKVYPDLVYFPAYEIFMDDLRDYRFYDTDMMHPGSAGVDYVWNKFVGACMDPASFLLMDEIESIIKAISHRPRNFLTNSHQNFVATYLSRIASLQSKYPFLNFSTEEKLLKDQLLSDQA